ncbi:hypothetical protein [Sphingomonas sp. PAMC 26605]|uniref:hypothetical protein n=1 Tax=Sphingomonas sp. PAMC 26605 TaxID=1112214 RepID=UPI0002F2DDCA|nr:hypothetical protein [Sphingomonas sp. PAMC 26605]
MPMPDDVNAALERFQNFLGHCPDELVDAASGFTKSDGMLLVGEVGLSHAHDELGEYSMD